MSTPAPARTSRLPSAARGEASGTRVYLRLVGHLKPYRGMFALGVVGTVALAATDPAIAWLLKPLLDGSFIEKDPELIHTIPLALVGIFLVRGIAEFTGTVATTWVGNRVVADLRERMFARLLAVPGEFHDSETTGNLISKFSFDATQLTQSTTKVLITLVRDSVSVLGLFGLMLYLNWKLTLIALVCAPLVAVIVHYFSKRMRRLNRELIALMGHMNHLLDEAIGGHRIVKIYGAQESEHRRFAKLARRVHHFNLKVKVAAALHAPLVHLITVASLATIIWIASRQSAAENFSVGEFASFMAAMGMLLAPTRRLAQLNELLQKAVAAAQSVFGLIDQPVEEDRGDYVPEKVTGHLRLEGVGFTYAGSRIPALHDVDLEARPGETIALVGPSGSGKSTVVKLLPRLYHPTSGRILLDGIDTRDYRLDALRRQFAYVGQETVLFNDTVAVNIGYGSEAAIDRERLVDAARQAHALAFIEELPEGFDTVIGEEGVLLSGGQRQRLAIARALYKDAPVLLLDEATSALDSEAERHVQEALDSAKAGRTTLVIAHRLSTVVDADRIVLLDRGRVVESGNHEELLRADGLYARHYALHLRE